jgi:hypothetical protein
VKRPERWWIVDAVAHRQTERAQAMSLEDIQAAMPQWLKGDGNVEVITMMPADDDDWVCDYCNDPVPLTDSEGVGLFVPMHGGSALCPGCFTDLRADPAPGATPLGGWSDVTCGCPGCADRLTVLYAESVVAALAAQLGEES